VGRFAPNRYVSGFRLAFLSSLRRSTSLPFPSPVSVILNSPAVSNSPNLPAFGTGRDIGGIVLFVIGFLVEAVSDWQKVSSLSDLEAQPRLELDLTIISFIQYQHKQADPPKPKNRPCTTGLWKLSRRSSLLFSSISSLNLSFPSPPNPSLFSTNLLPPDPPYFGEILLHWGLWMLCLSPSIPHQGIDLSASYRKAQFAAVFSPLLTMALLLFLSGMPLAEKSAGKKFWLMSCESPLF